MYTQIHPRGQWTAVTRRGLGDGLEIRDDSLHKVQSIILMQHMLLVLRK